MEQIKFIKYLEDNHCSLQNTGKKHLLFIHEISRLRSTVPIQPEIKELLVRKICVDLGVYPPK